LKLSSTSFRTTTRGTPWLRVLEPLSAYATTYRYPSPTGKRKGGPSNDEMIVWIKTIAGLNLEARAALLKSAAPHR
jgi:hypothetical protein